MSTSALVNIVRLVTLRQEFVTTVKQATGDITATETVRRSANTNATATRETVSRAPRASGVITATLPVSVKIVPSVHELPAPVPNVTQVTMVPIVKSFVSQKLVKSATRARDSARSAAWGCGVDIATGSATSHATAAI